jgi:hypothetical protein
VETIDVDEEQRIVLACGVDDAVLPSAVLDANGLQ